MKKVYKTFEVSEKKTIDAEAGIYEAWISTESVDRDNDILLADGVQLDNYRKNPVVLFGHNYREVEAVVGKALEVEKVSGQGIRARWQFTPKGDNPKADIVHKLWAGGFLNATSVGFNPTKYEQRNGEDGKPLDWGYLFTEWELLEFSIVPVPANQDALRLALKAFEAELKDPEEETEDTYSEPVTTTLDVVQEPEMDVDPDNSVDDQLTDDEINDFADEVQEFIYSIQEVLE